MKRAAGLLIASIAPYRTPPDRTFCAARAVACDWRGNRSTPAARLAAILGGLALCMVLTGCGVRRTEPPATPLILNLPDCPAPSSPALPLLDGSAPLDSPANVERLMERDDRIRAHIDGLNAAIRCFQAGRTYGNQ